MISNSPERQPIGVGLSAGVGASVLRLGLTAFGGPRRISPSCSRSVSNAGAGSTKRSFWILLGAANLIRPKLHRARHLDRLS